MDSARPTGTLTLSAWSVASDLALLALVDVAEVLKEASAPGGAVLIGGHMVTLHAERWHLGRDLYRETKDADLGAAILAVSQGDVVDRLVQRGYRLERGGQFVREVDDIPAELMEREAEVPRCIVDVVVPAKTSRSRKNIRVGSIVTIEVPGLAMALARPSVTISLRITRMNKQELTAEVAIPDETSALVLKTLAWNSRMADKDALDIWRCLEIARAAGVRLSTSQGDDVASVCAVLERAFATDGSPASEALVRQARLSPDAARKRLLRVRALLADVLA
jgi:hypothetical protein